MRETKRVDDEIRNLWALMATQSAKRAVQLASCDRNEDAEKAHTITARWLTKAGSKATERHYRRPI